MGGGCLSEFEASVHIYAFLKKSGDCDDGFSSLLGSWVRVRLELRDMDCEACLSGSNLISAVQRIGGCRHLGKFLLSYQSGLRNKDVRLRFSNSDLCNVLLGYLKKERGVGTPNSVVLYFSGFMRPLTAAWPLSTASSTLSRCFSLVARIPMAAPMMSEAMPIARLFLCCPFMVRTQSV